MACAAAYHRRAIISKAELILPFVPKWVVEFERSIRGIHFSRPTWVEFHSTMGGSLPRFCGAKTSDRNRWRGRRRLAVGRHDKLIPLSAAQDDG
jgi:hypothetical protein